MKKWKTLKSESVFESPIVHLKSESCQLDDGRIKNNYMVLESADWVNVVALTPENKILLVNQYRQAVRSYSLEIPGGAIDRQDQSVDEAGRRELLEETGYEAGEILFATKQRPNPALLNNTLHTFVYKNCVRVSEPHWDEFEEMEIEEVTLAELEKKVRTGAIDHSLILASLFLAWPTLLDHIKGT